jgi:hypothetical protein
MNNAMNTKTYETRGVLAGAYRGGRSSLSVLLTHLADAETDLAYCRKTINIADHYSGSDEQRAARPTCPKCAAKWDKLNAGAVRS